MYDDWMKEVSIIISNEEIEKIEEKHPILEKLDDVRIWIAKKILGI